MKALLSIKPEYVEKIFSGEKKFEYRKCVFSNKKVKTILIYATMPVGKVVGEFEMDGILSASPLEIWNKTKDFSGISEVFFNQYFKDKNTAHAIQISKIKIYKNAKRLNEVVLNNVAPQSFCYVD